MRFSFSAFVFIIFSCGASSISEFGSTKVEKKPKNHQHATSAATPEPTPPISYLVAQPGLDCSIRAQPVTLTAGLPFTDTIRATGFIAATAPTQSDDDKRYYTLRATVSNATIAFAERPTRTALTVFTNDFVTGFKDLFETSNPNGALTFVSEEEGLSSSLDGPLIAILSEPKIVGTNLDSTLDIEYNITRSDSQRAVGSIEKFIDTTFRSCSIFIDSTNDRTLQGFS